MLRKQMIVTTASIGLIISGAAIVLPRALAQESRPSLVPSDVRARNMNDPALQEQDFFQNAASDNTLEVRLGKLAEQRATNPDVKKAAQMMETDHDAANKKLVEVAHANHIDVNLDMLTPADQACYDQLNMLEGDRFERMYVFSQAGGHAKDELIMAYHANHGTDIDKQYASQVLPTIQMHKEELERIGRSMAGLPAHAETAGERMSPEVK